MIQYSRKWSYLPGLDSEEVGGQHNAFEQAGGGTLLFLALFPKILQSDFGHERYWVDVKGVVRFLGW